MAFFLYTVIPLKIAKVGATNNRKKTLIFYVFCVIVHIVGYSLIEIKQKKRFK